MPEKCGIKDCKTFLGPGAAEVGFENNGKTDRVRVCSNHAWQIMVAARGTWRITPDKRLVPIPAQPKIIT